MEDRLRLSCGVIPETSELERSHGVLSVSHWNSIDLCHATKGHRTCASTEFNAVCLTSSHRKRMQKTCTNLRD